jgi:2-polyprenyl-3-methyl-5-hydroxy-6-metoxy-1,4-benzoquinol methylase
MSLPPPAEATSTAREYLGRVRDFYESSPARKSPLEKAYRKVLARHYRHIIPAGASVLEIGCGRGGLLELLPNPDVTGIDLCRSRIEEARIRVPHGRFHVMSGEELDLGRSFDFIIIPDTINEAADAQAMLEAALKCTRPDTRLVVNFYNTLWKPLLGLASTCGIRTRQPLQSWLSGSDVENLLSLSGWELIRKDAKFLLPFRFPFWPR